MRWPLRWSGAASPAGWPALPRSAGPSGQVWLVLVAALALAAFSGLLTAMGGGYIAVLFVLATTLAVAGMLDFRFAVFALMLAFPLTATYFFPRKLFGVTGLNPFNVLFLFALSSFLLHRLFSRRERLAPLPSLRFFWPLAAALAAGTIIGSRSVDLIPAFYYRESILFETKGEYVRDVFVKPLITLTFVYLIAAAVARSRRMQPWAWLVLLGGSTLAVLVLLFVVLAGVPIGALSEASARSFLSPTGLHANELGVALLPLYAIALFMVPALPQARARFAAMSIAALALVALALTFSRAAFLAVLLVSVLFAVKRRRLIWVLFALAIVVLAALMAPQPIKDRLVRGWDTSTIGARNSSSDTLTAGRVGGIWRPLWPDARGHAIVGNGIHSTMWSSAARRGLIFVGHPHNAFLQLIMDYGVVFGALVVLFLWRVWRLWRRLARSPAVPPVLRAFFDGVSVAFIAFLGQCLTGSTLVFELSHAVYLGALGLALGVAVRLERDAGARRMAPGGPRQPAANH
ncbi:MAG: O-antigen ligase family protein [Rubrivivax sp.]